MSNCTLARRQAAGCWYRGDPAARAGSVSPLRHWCLMCPTSTVGVSKWGSGARGVPHFDTLRYAWDRWDRARTSGGHVGAHQRSAPLDAATDSNTGTRLDAGLVDPFSWDGPDPPTNQ